MVLKCLGLLSENITNIFTSSHESVFDLVRNHIIDVEDKVVSSTKEEEQLSVIKITMA